MFGGNRIRGALAGPRDERLQRLVIAALAAHDELDVTMIRVAVADGTVTLAGRVASDEEKGVAAQVVQDVPGVRGVRNELGL
jgi:osmotically-inducible protein OsmY